MSNPQVTEPIRLAIMEIMMILYRHGIKEIHIGAIMRLVGVDDAHAKDSDDERIILSEDFPEYLNQFQLLVSADSENQILH